MNVTSSFMRSWQVCSRTLAQHRKGFDARRVDDPVVNTRVLEGNAGRPVRAIDALPLPLPRAGDRRKKGLCVREVLLLRPKSIITKCGCDQNQADYVRLTISLRLPLLRATLLDTFVPSTIGRRESSRKVSNPPLHGLSWNSQPAGFGQSAPTNPFLR